MERVKEEEVAVGHEFEFPRIPEDTVVPPTESLTCLSVLEASRLCTLLHKFREIEHYAQAVQREEGTSEGTGERDLKVPRNNEPTICGWPLRFINEIERDFLVFAGKACKSGNLFCYCHLCHCNNAKITAFQLIDLDCCIREFDLPGAVLVVHKKWKPSLILDADQVALLEKALVERTSARGAWHYGDIYLQAHECLKYVFSEAVGDLVDKEKFDQSKADMILASDFRGAEEDVVGFGTAAVFGLPTSYYANPNLFRDFHFPFAARPIGKNNKRVYRDLFYQMISVPPHELIHSLQTLSWKKEVSEWRKEMEASIPAYGALHHAAATHSFMFPNGIAHESLMLAMEATQYLHSVVGKEMKEKYRAFRDCFGQCEAHATPFGTLEEAGEDFVTAFPYQTWYTKVRLSAESYKHMKTHWESFVRASISKIEGKDDVEYPPVEFENLEDMLEGTLPFGPDLAKQLCHLIDEG